MALDRLGVVVRSELVRYALTTVFELIYRLMCLIVVLTVLWTMT